MAAKFRFEPCPACCDCPFFSDDFDRSDSTSLGSDWDERSGDWSISSNALHEAGTSGALVVCEVKPQGDKISFRVRVDLVEAADNDAFRVVVNYKDDENYHYAEYIRTPGDASGVPNAELRLCKRDAGVNSTLAHIHVYPATGEYLIVCFSSGQFYAYLGSSSYEHQDLWLTSGFTPFALGYKAGLGNGYSQAIDFDNFVLAENYSTNANCDGCRVYCGGTPLPMTLDLRIVCTDPSYPIDDTITLSHLDVNDMPVADYEYLGSGPAGPCPIDCIPDGGCPWHWYDMDFALDAGGPGSPATDLTLILDYGSGAEHVLTAEAGSDCSPLDAEFVYPANTCGGSYPTTYHVTESP